MILQNRTAWNVQRLFWYRWRDPDPADVNASCSFCASAGLVQFDRTRPAKPAFSAFTELHGRDAPGPRRPSPGDQVSPTTRRRPSPSPRTSAARPSSAGSTEAPTSRAARRIRPRRSPTATMPSSSRRSMPRATRAQFVWRGFTVDTQPRRRRRSPTPTPTRGANDNAPEVKGTAAAGTTVRLYKTAGCTGTPVGVRSAANFASPGHHRLGPRQHDHGLPRPGGGRRRQPLGVLGRPLLRRGLDAVARSPADVCELCDAGL